MPEVRQSRSQKTATWRREILNPRHDEDIVHRYIVSGRSLSDTPRVVRRVLEAVHRKRQARNYVETDREQYQLSLLAHDELMAKAEGYRKRACARRDLANYMLDVVLPQHFDTKILSAAEKLLAARQTGQWGIHADGSPARIWDDKSGLLKFDPDESREEAKRMSTRYGAFALQLAQQGRGVHFLVSTVPNVDAGELAEAQRALFRRWFNFKRIQRNKQKDFPEIVGDIAIMESPLAADGGWNVHLNVLLLTEKPFHSGLYEKIRREWKFNVHIRPIKGDAGEIARAFNELLKYAVRTVPEKSHDKRRRHASNAPAMTEWPVDRFVEYFEAQYGFRRTRTYGDLYARKCRSRNLEASRPRGRHLVGQYRLPPRSLLCAGASN